MTNVLPPEIRLDYLAQSKWSSAQESLTAIYTENCDSFINSGHNQVTANQETHEGVITALTNQILGTKGNPHAYEVAREAFFFSHRLAEILLGEKPLIAMSTYLMNKDAGSDFGPDLVDDVAEYLADSPSLEALLGHFMPEIDKSRGFENIAENIGGITLLAIDIGTLQQYQYSQARMLQLGYHSN